MIANQIIQTIKDGTNRHETEENLKQYLLDRISEDPRIAQRMETITKYKEIQKLANEIADVSASLKN